MAALLIWGVLLEGATAQILPDATLGRESSQLTPNAIVKGRSGQRIDGGTRRGSTLFHSFREFNVRGLERVYFASPTGVQTILSRVTGRSLSRILGTLGVEGGANLFLLNPNGIVFGPDAQLDIAGSFIATTADRLHFPDGSEFSATNPQPAPLLSVNLTPGLQLGRSSTGATIASQGRLTTGQNLILVGDRLDLQGNLQAGRDVILQAADTVQLRDRPSLPLVVQAGKALTIQGDRAVDIFALSHPQTRIQSGSDLTLISDGTISGDAHFTSGAGLALRSLTGTPANFVSLYDPIIRATGDVTFGNYTGAALKVEAGGSIVGGGITITSPDSPTAIPANDPDFAALTTTRALILRAGVDSLTGSTLPVTAGATTFTPTPATGLPLGSIQIGFARTTSATAGINGGPIVLEALGNVQVTGQFAQGPATVSLGSYMLAGVPGNGGEIRVISRTGSISTQTGDVISGTDQGRAGRITLQAARSLNLRGVQSNSNNGVSDSISLTGDAINFLGGANSLRTRGDLIIQPATPTQGIRIGDPVEGTPDDNTLDLTTSDLATFQPLFRSITIGRANGSGAVVIPNNVTFANPVTIQAPAGNGSITATGRITGTGNASVSLIAAQDIATAGIRSPAGISLTSRTAGIVTTGLLDSTAATGNSGRITLTAAKDITTQSLNSGNFGAGNAGDVVITSGATVSAVGEVINSSTFGTGTAGDITIRARTIAIDNSEVLSGTAANGQAGAIDFQADSMVLSNSLIASGSLDAGSSGDLALRGRSIALTNGTQVIAGTTGNGQGGRILINATERLEMRGTDPEGDPSEVSTGASGRGAAGAIDITTANLVMRDGAIISSTALGANTRSGGDTTVRAGAIDLSGTAAAAPQAPTRIATSTFGTANAGDLTIDTDRLSLHNGAVVATSTFAAGRSGDLRIDARRSVALSGVAQVPSGQIPTALSADTFGSGEAGDMTLNTERLTLRDGAVVSVSTFGQGDGGSLVVNADRVRLQGSAPDRLRSGFYAQAFRQGNAGSVTLNAAEVTLRDRATITVASGRDVNADVQTGALRIAKLFKPDFEVPTGAATGASGNLTVTAEDITLDRNSQLLASTDSVNGGNIRLREVDLLLLRRGSLISASAGTERASGNGGNITIDSDFVVSAPRENNDIIANAFFGSGGRVEITTLGIYWMILRSRADLIRELDPDNPVTPRRLDTNDITAFSETNPQLNGQVILNTPDLDPSRGLVPLPTNLVDPTNQIAQGCDARGAQFASSFTNTGRGGLPPAPIDLLQGQEGIATWITLADQPSSNRARSAPIVPTALIEAQTWVRDAQGQVTLIAGSMSPAIAAIACPASRSR
jgi:filamentous hemagglutinin family protein